MSKKGSGKKANIASGLLLAMSLLGLGGINTQGSTYENLSSLVGSAIGALGSFAIKKAGDKKKGSGKSKIGEHHKTMVHDIMKNDKSIHVDELKYSEEKKQDLAEKLESHKGKIQSGSGLFDNLKKAAKKFAHKASHELKLFVEGKKKLKPSQLLNYIAASVGLMGSTSALIPGVNLLAVPTAAAISLGLKSVATAAKTSGRGKKYPKEGGSLNPAGSGKLKKLAKSSTVISGLSGLALLGAVAFKSWLMNNQAQLAHVALMASKDFIGLGKGKMPKKVKKFIEENPEEALIIARDVKQGSGLKLAGQGLKLAGQGREDYRHCTPYPKCVVDEYKEKLKRGKVQNRDIVYKGKEGQYKTSGGLYKCDLMIGKGGKVISKKKHAMGKKLYSQHGGKLKRKKIQEE